MISHATLLEPTSTQRSPRLRAVNNPGGYNYLLALPDDYASEPTRRWPLLFFLHGAGPRGSNLWDLTREGLPRLLAPPVDLTDAELAVAGEIGRNFVVVAPQCPHFEVWDDAAVLALLDDVGSELNVDAARVYLTGLSMGGFGAWSLAMRYPQRFAALVPVCGGGRVADVLTSARNRRETLARLGVWAFHGARDIVVPVEESQRMVDALRAAGAGDVQLTVYPDVEHDAWTRAYATPELYPWILQHEH